MCDGAEMAIFGDFASCICSEPPAAHFRPAFKIRTRATSCVEVWQTSDLRPLRLGEEKKEGKKKERNYRAKIYMVSLLHRATIKNPQLLKALALDKIDSYKEKIASIFILMHQKP